IDDWEFKPPLHPNCRCTILSTVAEEYGLDNLEEGKSIGIDNWFPSKKQAEIELRYDDSLVKLFHDRKDKTVREIADEFGSVSFQTIGKWMVILKEWEESKHPRDDKGRFAKSASGRLVSNYIEYEEGPIAASGEIEKLKDIDQFEGNTKIILTTNKFEFKKDQALKLKENKTNRAMHKLNPHLTEKNQYFSILNNATKLYKKNSTTMVFEAFINKKVEYSFVYVNPKTGHIEIGTGFINNKDKKEIKEILDGWELIKEFKD
ncbi:MAG: hypothetical protein OEY49_16755, partial [Candidatus Heimdallarchaeota archaeon]|nr:hypothetical protein [Candidatus Heimdallarchaeota archaeon]